MPGDDEMTITERRKFDQARTPFDRLSATGILPSDVQTQEEALRTRSNPRQLRRDIYRLIERLLHLPAAKPGSIQNVCGTLFTDLSPAKAGVRPATSSIDRTITAGEHSHLT
jgi:hypothetical protein